MTETQYTATQVNFQLAGFELDGYKLEHQQVYGMSLTGLANLADRYPSSVTEWLKAVHQKPLLDKGCIYASVHIKGDSSQGLASKITFLNCEVCTEYLFNQLVLGNHKVLSIIKAITQTTLEERIRTASGQHRTLADALSREKHLFQNLTKVREECKIAHTAFAMRCKMLKFPGNLVHDEMTMRICGLNAEMARELKQFLKGDAKTGLNHYQLTWEHYHALRWLTEAKKLFAGLRKNTHNWELMVATAVTRAKSR